MEQEVFGNYEALPNEVLREISAARGIPAPRSVRTTLLKNLNNLDKAIDQQSADLLNGQNKNPLLALQRLAKARGINTNLPQRGENYDPLEDLITLNQEYEQGTLDRQNISNPLKYEYAQRRYQDIPERRNLAVGEPFLETPPTRIQPPRAVKSPRHTTINTPTRIEVTTKSPRAAARVRTTRPQETVIQFLGEETIIPTEADIRNAKIVDIRDWLASFGLGHKGLRLKADYVKRGLEVRNLLLQLGQNGSISEEEWIINVPERFI